MAELSFRDKESELRASELLEGDIITIQCEISNNEWAWASINLNVEDVKLLISWLDTQIKKIDPK